MPAKQRQADALLISTTLLAAFGWICSREAITGIPALAFIGLRFLSASAVLLLLCRATELRYTLHNIRPVLISGLLQSAYMLLWIYAVATTRSLGEGAFIMSLSMLFVPIFTWMILRTAPARAFWFSLPAGIAGLALLTLKSDLHFEHSQLLFLCAALIQAIYFCFTTRFAAIIPVCPLAAVQLACTGSLAGILSLASESWPSQVEPMLWGWLVASVLLATSLRFWLQLKGQSMTSAANAALIINSGAAADDTGSSDRVWRKHVSPADAGLFADPDLSALISAASGQEAGVNVIATDAVHHPRRRIICPALPAALKTSGQTAAYHHQTGHRTPLSRALSRHQKGG